MNTTITWVAVQCRMPQYSGIYLVTTPDSDIRMSYYDADENTWTIAYPVAWAYLPRPFEGENCR